MAFKKPKDYDDVKVNTYRELPADGYVCRILKAEETVSSTGKDMLKVAFDIAEGDYKDFFREAYENIKAASDTPKDVKWPFAGTKWILLFNNEGATNKDFKSFCTALEDSGTEVWQKDTFNISALKNAEVGIIFRREEHDYQGRSWRVVPCWFRSADAIRDGDFKIPEDKPLPPKPTDYSEITDSFQAADDDIPF